MALKVEGVVDGDVNAEKTLSGAGRLEPLHLAFSSWHRLMGVSDSVVLPQPLAHAGRSVADAGSGGVRAQLVGD